MFTAALTRNKKTGLRHPQSRSCSSIGCRKWRHRWLQFLLSRFPEAKSNPQSRIFWPLGPLWRMPPCNGGGGRVEGKIEATLAFLKGVLADIRPAFCGEGAKTADYRKKEPCQPGIYSGLYQALQCPAPPPCVMVMP